MTKARIFAYKPALAKIAAKPGGLSLADAVRSASSNLEGVRERSLASLEPELDRMRTLARAAAGANLSAEDRTELSRLANGVIGVAGSFGLIELSRAAYSLCELLDVFEECGRVDPQALMVHTDSLRLLRSLSAPDQQGQRETILNNLHLVVERMRQIGCPDNAPAA